MTKTKSATKKAKKATNSARGFFAKHPVATFFGLLILIFGLIAAGSYLRSPKEEDKKDAQTKEVSVFKIGEKPSVNVQGKVEDSSNVVILAQTGGIVSSIGVEEGQIVKAGKRLVNISNNYSGGNAASVSRQMAERQYRNVTDTYDDQQEMIRLQRELANKVDENSSELRDIGSQSIDSTKNLVHQSNEMLDILNETLDFLEDNNEQGENAEEILAVKQGILQQSSALTQLEAGLRGLEYSSASDKPPSELSTLQKDLTLKQIDLQEEALKMGKDMAALQLAAARIGESIFFPTSPITGMIEKVHVGVNGVVGPGMPLITIRGGDDFIRIVTSVSAEVAENVNLEQESIIDIDGDTYFVKPSHVSTVPTAGLLYSMTYLLEEGLIKPLAQNSFVGVIIPLFGNCEVEICFVPLESIHQTKDTTTVYVVEDDRAVSKDVVLGTVFGSFVEIEEGLGFDEIVIVSRNVIDGDSVTF